MYSSHIAALLAKILGMDYLDIAPDAKLTAAYGVKPIDIAKLVIACEKHFSAMIQDEVIIRDEDVHTFECIDDIARYIEAAVGEGHDGPLAHSEEDRVDWFYI